MNPARRSGTRSSKGLYRLLQRVNVQIYKKKEGIDLKTTRHVNTWLVLRTEARPINFVDVVTPIDATGHPQLTSALGRRAMRDREGSWISYTYVRSALLRLMCIALEGRGDA